MVNWKVELVEENEFGERGREVIYGFVEFAKANKRRKRIGEKIDRVVEFTIASKEKV